MRIDFFEGNRKGVLNLLTASSTGPLNQQGINFFRQCVAAAVSERLLGGKDDSYFPGADKFLARIMSFDRTFLRDLAGAFIAARLEKYTCALMREYHSISKKGIELRCQVIAAQAQGKNISAMIHTFYLDKIKSEFTGKDFISFITNKKKAFQYLNQDAQTYFRGHPEQYNLLLNSELSGYLEAYHSLDILDQIRADMDVEMKDLPINDDFSSLGASMAPSLLSSSIGVKVKALPQPDFSDRPDSPVEIMAHVPREPDSPYKKVIRKLPQTPEANICRPRLSSRQLFGVASPGSRSRAESPDVVNWSVIDGKVASIFKGKRGSCRMPTRSDFAFDSVRPNY